MRKDQIAKRRAVNQRLAELDASRRCSYCKLPLGVGWWRTVSHPGSFCSEACADAAVEVEQLKAATKC